MWGTACAGVGSCERVDASRALLWFAAKVWSGPCEAYMGAGGGPAFAMSLERTCAGPASASL